MKAQGVPRRHLAFVCPICRTVQSMESLAKAGVAEDEVEKYIGFSCVGRFKGVGSHPSGGAPGKGCNWTLGGLLRLHRMEVKEGDKTHVHFELATPEQAKDLMDIRKKKRTATATPATPAPTAPAKKPEPPPRFPGIILREMAPDTSPGAVVRLMVELDAQARVCGFWFETLGSNESEAGMAAMRVGMLAVEEERRCY